MPDQNLTNDLFDVRNSGVTKYSTFSGADIKAVFGQLEVGNLQGISLSINREVRPVFVMGDPNPVSYSRGKRGIAGSMILTMFDRSAFHDIMKNHAWYIKKPHEGKEIEAGSQNALLSTDGGAGGYAPAKPEYSDQIPPFTITLLGVNEFGASTTMSIHGVHLISEGSGISIDDTIQEAQFTFVARQVKFWRPAGQAQGSGVSYDPTS